MKLDIAVSCNERYVPGAVEALAGVAVYAKEETELRFHVFTEGVRPESIEWMRGVLVRLHAKSELVEHKCDEKILAGLPYWAGSRMAAVRCHYATLMPEVDWCLYLDCDVLYMASVEEHFATREDGVYACCVLEEDERTRRNECRWMRERGVVSGEWSVVSGEDFSRGERVERVDVGWPAAQEDRYFNSGVVLFNFKKMREDGIPARLMEFFAKYPDVPSPDQDALNACFDGKIKLIDKKFDRLQIYLTDEKMKGGCVIHYVNGNPWVPKYGCVANGRFRLWHRFADKYIWQKRGESYQRCFSRKIIAAKYICYYLLVIPVVGAMFAWFMKKIGISINGRFWRWSQIQFDISTGSKI